MFWSTIFVTLDISWSYAAELSFIDGLLLHWHALHYSSTGWKIGKQVSGYYQTIFNRFIRLGIDYRSREKQALSFNHKTCSVAKLFWFYLPLSSWHNINWSLVMQCQVSGMGSTSTNLITLIKGWLGSIFELDIDLYT